MHHQSLLNQGCQHQSFPVTHVRNRQTSSSCRARTLALDVHPLVGRKCAMKPDAMVEARNVQWFARSELEEMASDAAEVEPPIRQVRECGGLRAGARRKRPPSPQPEFQTRL